MPRNWDRRRRRIAIRIDARKGSEQSRARDALELAPWEEAVGKLTQSRVSDGEIVLVLEMGDREVTVAIPCHSFARELPPCGKIVGVLRTDAGYLVGVI